MYNWLMKILLMFALVFLSGTLAGCTHKYVNVKAFGIEQSTRWGWYIDKDQANEDAEIIYEWPSLVELIGGWLETMGQQSPPPEPEPNPE